MPLTLTLTLTLTLPPTRMPMLIGQMVPAASTPVVALIAAIPYTCASAAMLPRLGLGPNPNPNP